MKNNFPSSWQDSADSLVGEELKKVLEKKDIIRSATAMKIYTSLNDVKTLQAGVYDLNNSEDLETILTGVDAPNAEIYYTENVNATSDITDSTNGWTTSLLDNAKLYLIKLNYYTCQI